MTADHVVGGAVSQRRTHRRAGAPVAQGACPFPSLLQPCLCTSRGRKGMAAATVLRESAIWRFALVYLSSAQPAKLR